MKKITIFLIITQLVCMSFTNSVFAQKPMKGIKVLGAVIEQNSQQPVGYATVVLKDKSTDALIEGTTTLDDVEVVKILDTKIS